MPLMPTNHQFVKRKCTICGEIFSYPSRPGRPRAICDNPQCVIDAQVSDVRYCIIDDRRFHATGNPYGPFYCSQRCQDTKKLCRNCANPCKNKFCSHACLQEFYPPPYACRVCSRTFLPDARWLQHQRSLNVPPKYCCAEHYEQRHRFQDMPEAKRGINPRLQSDYILATEHLMPTAHAASYLHSNNWKRLPLRPNGKPWIGVKPTVPVETLHPIATNSIAFWRHIIRETVMLKDLMPHDYNAYLFGFVCMRPLYIGERFTIMECERLWPYLEPYTDYRYDRRLFERMAGNYQHFARSYRKHKGSMGYGELHALALRCTEAYRQYTTDPEAAENKALLPLITKWLKPVVGQEENYAYDHPLNNPNQKYKVWMSRLQLEIKKFESVIVWVEDKAADYLEIEDSILSSLTTYHQFAHDRAKVMDNKRSKGPWPWGPNMYNELWKIDPPIGSPMDPLFLEIMNSPRYTMPVLR